MRPAQLKPAVRSVAAAAASSLQSGTRRRTRACPLPLRPPAPPQHFTVPICFWVGARCLSQPRQRKLAARPSHRTAAPQNLALLQHIRRQASAAAAMQRAGAPCARSGAQPMVYRWRGASPASRLALQPRRNVGKLSDAPRVCRVAAGGDGAGGDGASTPGGKSRSPLISGAWQRRGRYRA